jgi:hypothetical protein
MVHCIDKGNDARGIGQGESCSVSKENIAGGNIVQENIAVPKNRRYSYYMAPRKFWSILLVQFHEDWPA